MADGSTPADTFMGPCGTRSTGPATEATNGLDLDGHRFMLPYGNIVRIRRSGIRSRHQSDARTRGEGELLSAPPRGDCGRDPGSILRVHVHKVLFPEPEPAARMSGPITAAKDCADRLGMDLEGGGRTVTNVVRYTTRVRIGRVLGIGKCWV